MNHNNKHKSASTLPSGTSSNFSPPVNQSELRRRMIHEMVCEFIGSGANPTPDIVDQCINAVDQILTSRPKPMG